MPKRKWIVLQGGHIRRYRIKRRCRCCAYYRKSTKMFRRYQHHQFRMMERELIHRQNFEALTTSRKSAVPLWSYGDIRMAVRCRSGQRW